jgi:hypothetical protein
MEFLEQQLLEFLTLVLRYLIPVVLITLSVTYIAICPLLYLKRSKGICVKLVSLIAYYLLSPALWVWSATISLYYLGLIFTVLSIVGFSYFAAYLHFIFPMLVLAFFGDWESLLWYGGFYLGVWVLNWFVLFSTFIENEREEEEQSEKPLNGSE